VLLNKPANSDSGFSCVTKCTLRGRTGGEDVTSRLRLVETLYPLGSIRAATLETYCVPATGLPFVVSSLRSHCGQRGSGTFHSLPASVKNVAFACSSSAPHFRQ